MSFNNNPHPGLSCTLFEHPEIVGCIAVDGGSADVVSDLLR